jgi:hypothetical protein
MIRRYSELVKLTTFKERFNYLKLSGKVGEETFGFDRYINQKFYTSYEWRKVRDIVIVRDNGCDLGIEGYELNKNILIHHLNPISKKDIVNQSDILLNPEYLICVSHNTHNAIHYGDDTLLPLPIIERTPNDTCPWKH